MKNKYKKFLMSCNNDKHNQLCYSHERNIAKRLLRKGFIKKIDDTVPSLSTEPFCSFYIWLSKKGIKKVNKLINNEF